MSSIGSNMMRITGMATGMDTDAMVKAMTANYQYKIDKIDQEKQIMQWKQEMYRDIIKDIKGLQDYFDPISDKYILSESKFNPVKITNSDKNAVGFTASSSAQEGTYKINVTQLAEPAIVKGEEVSAASGLSTKLKDIDVSLSGKTITFTINDKPESVAISDATTIQNVIDEINNNTDIQTQGVTASFDELSKRFIFKTDNNGSAQTLKVKVTDGTIDGSTLLGFTESDAYLAGYTDSGQNAKFTITYPDGRTETDIEQQTNQFTANGITYNLKAAGTGDTTITVEKNDTDSVFNNIKSFIDDYNDIIEKIEGKISVKKQYTYKPLTEEQKKTMNEDDIKKWEDKAKQGILKNDTYLERLMGDLRGVLFDAVYSSKSGGTKNTYHMGIYGDGALGLDTSKDISQKGKIIIKDENKLKEAISNNIEEFTKFFIGKSTTENSSTKYIGTDTYYEDGLFTRMNKILRDYAGDPGIGKDGTSTLKGVLNVYTNKQYDYSITGASSNNTLPDQMYAKTLNIQDLQRQLTAAENRYYTQFAKLESAMNQMNSQMSNFYSQMGISQ